MFLLTQNNVGRSSKIFHYKEQHSKIQNTLILSPIVIIFSGKQLNFQCFRHASQKSSQLIITYEFRAYLTRRIPVKNSVQPECPWCCFISFDIPDMVNTVFITYDCSNIFSYKDYSLILRIYELIFLYENFITMLTN